MRQRAELRSRTGLVHSVAVALSTDAILERGRVNLSVAIYKFGYIL